MRSDGSDGVLDNLDPVLTVALLILGIVERHDLILKERIDGSGVERVLISLVLIGTLLRKRPSRTLAVAFNPPAVKDGEVDHTIHLGLLTGCAGSLQRTRRRVHPDVDTGNEAARELHVVVLKEDNLTEELGTLADLEDLLDQALTRSVSRMSLAGEEEQNGMLGIVDDLAQTIKICEEQMGALISGEATAEADHQRVRIDTLQQRHHTSRIALIAEPLLRELVADILDELLLQRHTRLPDLIVRNIVDSMPDLLVALILHERGIEVLVVDVAPLCCAPCGEMHAIGHITHMILFREIAFPDRSEHLLAHPAMELGHAVDFLTGIASEDTHAETLVVVIGILTAHADELIPADAQTSGVATHVLTEQTFVEIVVTGRNRRVYRIERRSTHELESLVEGQATVNIVDEALKVTQGSMTLVAMIELLLDAKLLEHQHATHTEQDLLLQTVLPVTAIKAVGDGLVKLRVHIVVGIKEIELDTSYIDLPDERMNLIVHVRHIHDNLVAVLVHHALNRQRVEVLCIILGDLLTVHAQALCEVTVTIKEADTAHVNIAVGGLFHVVAGEHAKTAGVDLQHLVQAILHGEVGHRRTAAVGLDIHVSTELGIDILHFLH